MDRRIDYRPSRGKDMPYRVSGHATAQGVKTVTCPDPLKSGFTGPAGAQLPPWAGLNEYARQADHGFGGEWSMSL